jgi:hypothetical protein
MTDCSVFCLPQTFHACRIPQTRKTKTQPNHPNDDTGEPSSKPLGNIRAIAEGGGVKGRGGRAREREREREREWERERERERKRKRVEE